MLEGVLKGNGLRERGTWTIPHIRERKTSREKGSYDEGEGQILLEARQTNDLHVAPRRCLVSRETSKTHKKVEEFYLYINLGVLT